MNYSFAGALCFAGLVAGFPLLAQQAPLSQPQPPALAIRPAPEGEVERGSYVLGPEDQILIRAVNVPDISEKPIRLDPKGEINMPLIGRIRAAGLTAEQLEAEVIKRLKVYLEEPDVAVTVAEFHSQPVSVIGEVRTPGVHQVQGRQTLVEMLSLAGGVLPDAGPNVRITRRMQYGRIPLPGAADDPTGRFSIASVDIRSLIEAKNPEKSIVISPYDIISVPKAEIVYVIGDVGKVGPLVLSEGKTISVLQAISSSGGVLRTAATSQAKILRPIMGGPKRAELPIDLKKIMKGQTNDLPLLAGDILFVPNSTTKRATTRAIEVAIQMGSLAGTYSVIR